MKPPAPTPLPQQPYFLRAMYEWCVDSGHTPYMSVRVDARTQVPQAYVKDGQIVLNVGPSAVRNLHMDNEWVTFSARFGGVSHIIEVPVGNVIAIHAKETGEGMAFAAPATAAVTEPSEDTGMRVIEGREQNDGEDDDNDTPPPPSGKRPQLRVVK